MGAVGGPDDDPGQVCDQEEQRPAHHQAGAGQPAQLIVTGKVEGHLHRQPEREHDNPECARLRVRPEQRRVVAPGHALAGDEADEHPEQRPTHDDRDQVRQAVADVDDKPWEEHVFGPPGTRRQERRQPETHQTRDDVLQRFAPQQPDRGQHDSRADGDPQRQGKVATGGGVHDREQRKWDAGVEERTRSQRLARRDPVVAGDRGHETGPRLAHATPAGSSSYCGLYMTRRLSTVVTRPLTFIPRPQSMPTIRHRPRKTSVSTSEPSKSSASREGTPARGCRVTVCRTPRTFARSRSPTRDRLTQPAPWAFLRSLAASISDSEAAHRLSARHTPRALFLPSFTSSAYLSVTRFDPDTEAVRRPPNAHVEGGCSDCSSTAGSAPAGALSGMMSPGAIGRSPRTTTVSRTTLTRRAKALASVVALPRNVARSIHRGPSIPQTRDGWTPLLPCGVVTGRTTRTSVPNGPAASLTVPPRRCASAAI